LYSSQATNLATRAFNEACSLQKGAQEFVRPIHGGFKFADRSTDGRLADAVPQVARIHTLLPNRGSPESEIATVGSEPQRSAHPSCSWIRLNINCGFSAGEKGQKTGKL
jgi:hypothetical protein